MRARRGDDMRPAATAGGAPLDAVCYWLRYADLRDLSWRELHAHYERSGRFERRAPACPRLRLTAETRAEMQRRLMAGEQHALAGYVRERSVAAEAGARGVLAACAWLRHPGVLGATAPSLAAVGAAAAAQGLASDDACDGLALGAVDAAHRALRAGDAAAAADARRLPLYPSTARPRVVYGAISADGRPCLSGTVADVVVPMPAAGGLPRATLDLLGAMLRRHPAASYYVKIDCDTALRSAHTLSAHLEAARPDYWGSCRNTLLHVRLANGSYADYAQGGLYALSARVAPRVLRAAAALAAGELRAAAEVRENEDLLVGAACAHLGVPLTCAGWMVSSFGASAPSVAYHPTMPKCRLRESHQARPRSADVVVAACRGDCANALRHVDALAQRGVRARAFVYEKCGPAHNCRDALARAGVQARVAALDNVGRCDHTYAHHLRRAYDDLADVVLFVKDTTSAWNHPATPPATLLALAQSYGFACGTQLYQETPASLRRYLPRSYSSPSIHHHRAAGRGGAPGGAAVPFQTPNASWRAFAAAHGGGDARRASTFTTCYGGVFAAQRAHARRQPRARYAALEAALSRGDNIVESHYAERLWGTLLAARYRAAGCLARCPLCQIEASPSAKHFLCEGAYADARGCLA